MFTKGYSELLGICEIAKLSGVGTSAVANWRKRFSDFPVPVVQLKSGPVFQKQEIETWLKGRSKPMVSSTTTQSETITKLEQAIEFADNPEPRCACVLLLDISGSMQGAKISALNQGLKVFKRELTKDSLASRRVEIAVVTFNSEVRVAQDFVTADQFEPPDLIAQGMTHMGAGIEKALQLIRDRKAVYRSNGVQYYRPWVFLITDGEPQGESADVVDRAAKAVQENEVNKGVAFFAVGVDGANIQKLQTMVVREPIKLQGLDFVEMFVWLSASAQTVSRSKADEMVALPPVGWREV